MKKNSYVQPQVEVVYMDAEELLQTPGASTIQNGDNEEPGPVTPGNPPGGIGSKPWFGDDKEETTDWH
ncbi:hypothetical protein SAMN04487825_102114 [Prevotella sp. kh1p2]|nr:hypothetical protein SAMN04487825_102114 [Prevotella sp. kh1p2]SNU10336.1 hypothetical protein SAMN06298210_10298 [Prevotellaceae bacterium KH2P17]